MSRFARLPHLAGVDASHLYDERWNRPTHTVKVLQLERDPGRPPLAVEELRDHVAARLGLLPALTERVVPVPGKLFHPIWLAAGPPDLAVHVRSLPEDVLVGDPSLEVLASLLASQHLPRDRPLWRLWLAPPTERRPEAIFAQFSHALADGHASARLLEVLFGAAQPPPHPAPAAAPAPTRRALLISGTAQLACLVGRLPGQLRPAGLTERPGRVEPGPAGAPFAGPSVPWGGPLEQRRTVAWSEIAMPAIDEARRRVGATIGEVVLALASGAVRAYFLSGRALPRRSLTAIVPMSPPGWHDASRGNFNRHAFVTLATDAAEPAERLRRITADLRAKRRAVTTANVARWARWLDYYPLFRLVYLCTVPTVGRVARRPPASMIVSVIHGPRQELRAAGVHVSRINSVGVLAEHLGLNLTVWSYGGRLSFTVVCSGEHVPLAAEIAGALPEAFAELAACSLPGGEHGLDATP